MVLLLFWKLCKNCKCCSVSPFDWHVSFSKYHSLCNTHVLNLPDGHKVTKILMLLLLLLTLLLSLSMPIDTNVFYNDQLASQIVGAFVTWQRTNSPEGTAHRTVDNNNNKIPKTRPEYEFNPGLWIWDWRQWCGLEPHNFPLELNAVNFRNAFINLLKIEL